MPPTDIKKFAEPSEVHVDQILTNISIKYMNNRLIADDLMPKVKVAKRSNKYWVYSRADGWRIDDDSLAPTALPNEINMKPSTDNYSVDDHGLADYVAQEEIDEADAPLMPLADASENIDDKLALAHEKRVADDIQNAANYPVGNKVQLAGTDQWSDYVNSDPLGDIQTAIESTIIRANVFGMGVDAWLKLRAHPKVLDAVKSSTRHQGTPGGFATPEEIISLLEIDKLVIGRARQNTANDGQAESLGRIWGKHAFALYVEQNPGIKKVSFGYTFSETLKQVFRGFDGKRGVKGAHYVKGAWNSDRKIVASDCGYFIEDAVA